MFGRAAQQNDETLGRASSEQVVLPMNWNAVAALAELLGAVAVVGSLLYLAAQVRQNTKQSRLAAQQVIVNRKLNIISAKSTDLDAEFYITSALGTRMIIYMVARDQATTRVVLMLGGRRDEALATLVLNEIEDVAATPKLDD